MVNVVSYELTFMILVMIMFHDKVVLCNIYGIGKIWLKSNDTF